MSRNPNHPKPGSRIKVEPVKSTKDIRLIKKLLADRPRDLAFFTLGINSAFRASDLLRIKVNQVRHLRPGDDLELNEKKTGKPRRVTLNKTCVEAIHKLLASRKYEDNEPLFMGQRGPLKVASVSRMVKSWCKAIHLKGNFASHTLRKTFGFHQRVTFGVDLPRLMTIFNHSSQRVTLQYLCVQPEEVKSVYLHEL